MSFCAWYTTNCFASFYVRFVSTINNNEAQARVNSDK